MTPDVSRKRLFTLAVLLSCLVGVTVAAGSLDEAVSTNPDKAVDVPADAVPIGTDTVRDVFTRIESGSDPQNSERETGNQASEDGQQTTVAPSAESPSEEGDPAQSSDSGDGKEDGLEPAETEGEGPGAGPGTPNLLEMLLSLLERLLGLLAVLAVLGGAAYLAYRYRDEIAAWWRERTGDPPGEQSDSGTPTVPSPSNEVSRAWMTMVEESNLDGARSLTPRECARRVAERSGARDAVIDLTETFEEVRYSDAPPTDQRRERARRDLEAFRAARHEGDEAR